MLHKVVKYDTDTYTGGADMKISVSLSEKLVNQLDDFSSENGLSRSAAISMAVTSFLTSRETVSAMRGLSDKMQELISKGIPATQEEMAQLDAISKVITMMK